MIVNTTFDIGQTVFLKTDIDQNERIVTEIHLRPAGMVYVLMFETTESYHYEFEITTTKDIVKATSG